MGAVTHSFSHAVDIRVDTRKIMREELSVRP